jgi:hypothetical protein
MGEAKMCEKSWNSCQEFETFSLSTGEFWTEDCDITILKSSFVVTIYAIIRFICNSHYKAKIYTKLFCKIVCKLKK